MEGSAPRPGRSLSPGKTRYPSYRRLGGPQGRSGRAENLVPNGIRSRDRPARSSFAIPTELPGPLVPLSSQFKIASHRCDTRLDAAQHRNTNTHCVNSAHVSLWSCGRIMCLAQSNLMSQSTFEEPNPCSSTFSCGIIQRLAGFSSLGIYRQRIITLHGQVDSFIQ